jgi:hypothetical protein
MYTLQYTVPIITHSRFLPLHPLPTSISWKTQGAFLINLVTIQDDFLSDHIGLLVPLCM